jgi:hypothetical protein
VSFEPEGKILKTSCLWYCLYSSLSTSTAGFAALLSAFPDKAKSLRGYNTMHPVEKCRQKVAEFKQLAEDNVEH